MNRAIARALRTTTLGLILSRTANAQTPPATSASSVVDAQTALPVADAQTASPVADPVKNATTRVVKDSLVVAGGVSLGSYQGGFLYYYTEGNKRLGQRIASASGASAGSINATIAAAESCRTAVQPDPTLSLFWKTWIPVGLDQLTPSNREISTLGLLSRAPLEEAAKGLRRYFEEDNVWEKDCHLPIAIVATRLAPEPRLSPLQSTAATERFALEFDSSVKGHLAHRPCPGEDYKSGEDRQACTPASIPKDSACRFRYPGSGTGKKGIPTFGDLQELLFASSAFPLAFEPRTLVSHDKIDGDVRSAVYVDGGVFDNIPVKMALELSDKHNVLVVDSDYAPWKGVEWPRQKYKSVMDALGVFLGGFIDAARTRELVAGKVTIPERRSMLSSDYLFAFSGFLDQRFRELDFYFGMLDARHYYQTAGVDVHAFDEGISSPTFACLLRLETLSHDFRLVPDWDTAVDACQEASKQVVERHHIAAKGADAQQKRMLDMVSLFSASVSAQLYSMSATGPSGFDIFQHFLKELSKRNFTFSFDGHEVEADAVIYELRQLAGRELTRLFDAQPTSGWLLGAVADVALNQYFFHLPPDGYWGLGVHLNKGVDFERSWGIDDRNLFRAGLGLRARQFSLLSTPERLNLSLDGMLQRTWFVDNAFGVEGGVEAGFGYRFGTTPAKSGKEPDPRDHSGARQNIGILLGAIFYDRIYLRFDARKYSRMSRHWPLDYGELEVGAALGWRFF